MSKNYTKWSFDDEVQLLENVEINKDNHLLTSINIKRSLNAVIARLCIIYMDRLKVYNGNTPEELKTKLYINDDMIELYNSYKKRKKNDIELLNLKIDFIMNRLNIIFH